MKTLATTVALVLSFATSAVAQHAPLSAREQRYASALAGSLGQRDGFKARRVQFSHAPAEIESIDIGGSTPAHDPRPAIRTEVNGVLVEANGVSVERLRFETAEQAQEHADWLLNGHLQGVRPVTGQLRGNQLVVIHGPAVEDPAVARRLLEAAWSGLPAPATTDAAFTQLEDGSAAVTTTLKDGPLRESLDRAMTAARERDATSDQITTTPTTAEVAFTTGFRAGLRVDEQGASVYTGTTPERAEVSKQHLAALGGHPAAKAVEGTAKRIEDLFLRR